MHAGKAAQLIAQAIGGAAIVLWIICKATRVALTAVFRQAMRTGGDSIMPSRLRGVTVR
jgi:hypothetical protein